MPDTAPPRASMLRIVGLMATVDLVTGIVLALIGVSQDMSTLTIIGVVLLLSGGAMLGYVTWQRNKPTAL